MAGLPLLAAYTVLGQGVGSEAHIASQSAADILRDVAQADGAFIAAGHVKAQFQKDDLSSLMLYPDEEVVIVRLKGSEVRQTFERALNLYPQSNTSFLQVSGFEVVFDPKAPTGSRVKSILANGSKMDEGREFKIAMPSSLGRGGFGYFKIWDRAQIVASLPITVEQALKGKRQTDSKPRWIAQN